MSEIQKLNTELSYNNWFFLKPVNETNKPQTAGMIPSYIDGFHVATNPKNIELPWKLNKENSEKIPLLEAIEKHPEYFAQLDLGITRGPEQNKGTAITKNLQLVFNIGLIIVGGVLAAYLGLGVLSSAAMGLAIPIGVRIALSTSYKIKEYLVPSVRSPEPSMATPDKNQPNNNSFPKPPSLSIGKGVDNDIRKTL